MDLTWSALLVILLIITPALCALALFRAFHPKIRYVQNSNLITIIFPSLFSLLVNIPLIGYYLNKAINYKVHSCTNANLNLIYELIFTNHTFNPIFRPAYQISSFIFSNTNDLDIVLFYIDIHLRVLFFGFVLSMFLIFCLWLDNHFGSIIYIKKPEELKKHEMRICHFLGYDSIERKNGWFSYIISKISNGFLFNQWNQLIGDNTKAHTLFCDIFFDDNNLYSGMLDNWLPKDANEISFLSLVCVLRYYPDTIDKEGNVNRKWKFIVNSGTLTFPFPKIKTVNIWKLTTNTSLKVAVNNKNDLEKLKWHLAVWHHKKDIFSSVIITVDYKAEFEDANKFLEYIDNFLSDSNYIIPFEKINAKVASTKIP